VYILDTDVLIDLQHGHIPAVQWFTGLTSVPELIQGAKNAQQVRDVVRLTASLETVWPTEVDCERALSDFRSLHLSHGLGLLDSLIAAIAIGRCAELCTFNQKHFRSVPALVTH
jgi:predicted nucleic acid-binding protein